MTLVDVVGWAGSALLVVSLLQTRVMRLRVLNTVACLVLVAYNSVLEVWPMVAVNAVLVGVNVWVMAGLLRGRHDAGEYDAVPIGLGEPLLHHLLARHDEDIRQVVPDLPQDPVGLADHAFLVSRDDSVVGVVLSRAGARPGEQEVVLDYVLPPYRDFTPGEFVFRADGPFARLGTRRVLAPAGASPTDRYLRAVGFRPEGDRLVLDLAA